MSGPLTREAIEQGLTDYLTATLGVDASNADEMEGTRAIARDALDYLSDSFRGAPPGSGRTLLWVLYSALWEGQVPQERIDAFFGGIDVDLGRLYRVWEAASQQLHSNQEATIALIPGKLGEAEIADVVAALYRQRNGVATF